MSSLTEQESEQESSFSKKEEKARKKAEGKARAVEIARQRALDGTAPRSQTSRPPLNIADEDEAEAEKNHNGHGSHNAQRCRVFVKFIMDTFFRVLHDDQRRLNPSWQKSASDESLTCYLKKVEAEAEDSVYHSILSKGSVLDVAGGNGELCLRMSVCHSLPSTMIDVREADLVNTLKKKVVECLPKKWKGRIEEKIEGIDLKDGVGEGVRGDLYNGLLMPRQLTLPFNNVEQVEGEESLIEAVKGSQLMVGLHADASTEAIVELAIKYGKAFAVVPCCVFPNLFSERMVSEAVVGGEEEVGEGGEGRRRMVHVRNHAQFCRYLMEVGERKGLAFKRVELGFNGRNVCVFWEGAG